MPSGQATAALVNFTAVSPAGAGNLRAWAHRSPPTPPPTASVLNYALMTGSGFNIANAIAVPICDATEAGQVCPFDFLAQADISSTHLVVDVVGFFERFPTDDVPALALHSGAIIIWNHSSAREESILTQSTSALRRHGRIGWI